MSKSKERSEMTGNVGWVQETARCGGEGEGKAGGQVGRGRKGRREEEGGGRWGGGVRGGGAG